MCYLFRSNVFENVIPGQVRYANLYQGNKSWDDKDLISLRLGFRRNFLSVLHPIRTDRKFLQNPNLKEINKDQVSNLSVYNIAKHCLNYTFM